MRLPSPALPSIRPLKTSHTNDASADLLIGRDKALLVQVLLLGKHPLLPSHRIQEGDSTAACQ